MYPWTLSWPEVDPARHPFDREAAPAVIRGLPPAAAVPSRRAGHAADPAVIGWGHGEGRLWCDAMSTALVEHYGPWASGWRWSSGEGDYGGGPVHAWCCPRDSMTTPDATLAVVAAALLEWRAWLEDLAARFDGFLPLPAGREAALAAWERAVAQLVTVVVDSTGAEDAWYELCGQVLHWFLAAAGVPEALRGTLVGEAIDGRFESWCEPADDLVTDVAGRLAAGVVGRGDA
ncbi:hypothetical protein GCM10009827_025500 [Dactylosporangium maewongense]|uniref:Uncharacterized protein n=1 Tax=Dactylosporangium maewongense TaxID=634393 RepID=A0ABN2A2Q0_9ACTN